MLMAMPWMSGLVMPLSTWVQESPPSLLRYTPSISTPAITVPRSTGSTSKAVTRVEPMAHSWLMGTDRSFQLLPPSWVRNTKPGLVPAKTVSESEGSMAMDQMFSPSMGESNFTQLLPESSLR